MTKNNNSEKKSEYVDTSTYACRCGYIAKSRNAKAVKLMMKLHEKKYHFHEIINTAMMTSEIKEINGKKTDNKVTGYDEITKKIM